MSNYEISSEECDRQIDKSEMPGTLMLVKRTHGPKGSNITEDGQDGVVAREFDVVLPCRGGGLRELQEYRRRSGAGGCARATAAPR